METTKVEAPLPTLAEITAEAKRTAIKARLLDFGCSRQQTAKSLGISRQQLHNLVKKLSIQIPAQIRLRHEPRRAQH